MRKSVKAALLSGLVFPGAGHFFLKRPISGAVLACAALSSLYLIISYSVERALKITEQIQRGEVPANVDTIAELVSRQPIGAEAQLYDMALLALLVSWLLGIFDSYRIGRAQDNDSVADR